MAKIQKVNLTDTINTQRIRINQMIDSIGDLALLTTDEDSDIVGAINSIDSNLGTRLSLTTINKTDIVTAINEHDTELGTITSIAMGTIASTVSTAIAELDGRLDSINTIELLSPRMTLSNAAASNTIAGDLNVDGLTTLDSTSIAGNLNVSINTNLTGNLNVDGLTVLDSTAIVGNLLMNTDKFTVDYLGNVQVAGNLNVDGLTTLDSTAIVGNLSVSANTALTGTLNVGDSSNFADNVSIQGNLLVGGNTTMSGTLTVDGAITFKAGAGSNIYLGDSVTDNVVFNADVNSSVIPNTDNTYDLGSGTQEWRNLYIDGVANIDGIRSDSATFTGNLNVDGLTTLDSAAIEGNLTVSANTALTGNLDVGGLTTLDSTSIAGNLLMNTNKFTVDYLGNVQAAGNLNVDGVTTLDSSSVVGNLSVSANTDLTGNLNVDGLTTLDSTSIAGNLLMNTDKFTVDYLGNVQVAGNLNVDGITTLDSSSIVGNLNVSANTALTGNLNVDGLTTLDSTSITGNLLMNTDKFTVDYLGNTAIAGTLNVGDSSNFADNVSIQGNLAIGGNTTMSGTLTVDGEITFKAGASSNINLGDTANDNVVFNADVNSSIIPNTDNTNDLGSATQEWRNLYIDGVANIDGIRGDSATFTGNLNVDGLTVLDSTAIAGNLLMNTDKFTVDYLGNVQAAGNLNVDGLTVLDSTAIAGNLLMNTDKFTVDYLGNVLAAGTLNVGDSSNFADNVRIQGNLSVNGSVTLGDAATDNVVFNADVNSNIIPNTDNTYDLGSPSQEWRHLYVDGTANVDNLAADSATIANNLTTNNLTVVNDFVVGGAFTVAGEVRTSTSYIILLDSSGNHILNAGIAIDRGNYDSAVLQWNETTNYWELNQDSSPARYRILTTADSNLNALSITSSNGDFTIDASGDITLDADGGQIYLKDGGIQRGYFDVTTLNAVKLHTGASTLNTTWVDDSATVAGKLSAADLFITDSAYIGGTLTIGGSLRVAGTTTTVNSETITFDDNILVLNNNKIDAPANGETAGLEVERGSSTNASLLWNETADRWTVSGAAAGTLAYTSELPPKATTSALGLIKIEDDTVQSTAANTVTTTASRTYGIQLNDSDEAVVNVPWTDTVYTLPAATTTVRGGIELEDGTVQSTAANTVTTTASRTYGLQVNAAAQGVINVPWTDTVYSLPEATATVRGGIELFSDSDQSVAANGITYTSSRTYGIQLNSSGQAVVNVPWVDTNCSLHSRRWFSANHYSV
jgi:hypothetical protein